MAYDLAGYLAGIDLAAGQPANSNIEGLPLLGLGNSYMQTGTTICMARYIDRISNWMRSTSFKNRGVSSALMVDLANYVHGTYPLSTPQGSVSATWTPSTNASGGFVIIEGVRNDAGWDGFETSAKSQAGFKNALDSILRLLRASGATQDTNAAFVYTGTWTSAANSKVPGGNSHNTTTAGDHVTITTPVGTDFDLVVLGGDTTINACDAWTITVDGTDITSTLAAQGVPTNLGAQLEETKQISGAPWVPVSIPLRGLSNQAHTVVLTHAGTAGKALYVCRLLQYTTNTGPNIIVMKATSLATYANYGGTASVATDTIYNGFVDQIVSRFPVDGSIAVIDGNANGWNPATMISSQDASHVHPNDLGMAFYASRIKETMNAMPVRLGCQVI